MQDCIENRASQKPSGQTMLGLHLWLATANTAGYLSPTWSFCKHTHVVCSEPVRSSGEASPFCSSPSPPFPLDEGSRESAVSAGTAAHEPSLAANFSGDFFLGGSCLTGMNGGPGALELEAEGRMTVDHGTFESPDVGKSISAIVRCSCECHHVVEQAESQNLRMRRQVQQHGRWGPGTEVDRRDPGVSLHPQLLLSKRRCLRFS